MSIFHETEIDVSEIQGISNNIDLQIEALWAEQDLRIQTAMMALEEQYRAALGNI